MDYIIDPLFGRYLPTELVRELVLTPEIQRLREVRMSNINSISLTGWSNQSRFEHSLGVARLAQLAAETLKLGAKEKCHLIAAALLHDIATPPFGHTTEYLFRSYFPEYSHEHSSRIIILGFIDASDARYGRFSQFFCGKEIKVHKILKDFKIDGESLEPSYIADLIQGKTELGKLIKKDIDMDNLDSVYRMAHHIGIPYDVKDPISIVQSHRLINGQLMLNENCVDAIHRWLQLRKLLYFELMTNPMDFSAKGMLTLALDTAYKNGKITREDWSLTDNELIQKLYSFQKTRELIRCLRVGDLFTVAGMFWIKDKKTIEATTNYEGWEQLNKDVQEKLGHEFYIYWILDDNKLSRKISLEVFSKTYGDISKGLVVSGEGTKSIALGKPSYSLLLGVLSRSYKRGIEARTKCRKLLSSLLEYDLAPVNERDVVSLDKFSKS